MENWNTFLLIDQDGSAVSPKTWRRCDSGRGGADVGEDEGVCGSVGRGELAKDLSSHGQVVDCQLFQIHVR